MYVAEDVNNLCEASPDEIGSGLETQSRDDPTCSGFLGSAPDVMQRCIDLKSATQSTLDAVLGVLDTETGSLAVIQELVVPIVRFIFSADGVNGFLSGIVDANFCLGEWTGDYIMSHHDLDEEPLYMDGCTYPPYVDANTYSVISLMVPNIILSQVGMCTTVNVDESVYFCVLYTGCESSLPTYALHISGTLVGCFLSNGAFSVASGGLSTLLGNAVSFALSDVAFGLSLTGEFEAFFDVYDGSKKEADLKGNFYVYVKFSTAGILPKAIEE